jgi:hypothetical protein
MQASSLRWLHNRLAFAKQHVHDSNRLIQLVNPARVVVCNVCALLCFAGKRVGQRHCWHCMRTCGSGHRQLQLVAGKSDGHKCVPVVITSHEVSSVHLAMQQ